MAEFLGNTVPFVLPIVILVGIMLLPWVVRLDKLSRLVRVCLELILLLGIMISVTLVAFGVLNWAMYVGPRPMDVEAVLWMVGPIVLGVLCVIVGVAGIIRGYQRAAAER